MNIGIGMLFVSMVYVLSLKPIIARKVRRRADNYLENASTNSPLRTIELILNKNGIIQKCDGVISEVPWESIIKYRKHKDHYYLILESNNAFVIPKTTIQDDHKFQSLILSNLSQPKNQ